MRPYGQRHDRHAYVLNDGGTRNQAETAKARRRARQSERRVVADHLVALDGLAEEMWRDGAEEDEDFIANECDTTCRHCFEEPYEGHDVEMTERGRRWLTTPDAA